MLKRSLVLALAGASVVNAFFVAPAPRASATTMMAGKATLDTLDRVVLTDDATGHSATVHLHGGCVTSYKAPHEVLGIRADAAFTGAKPIAGGLQICWPQFGPGAIQQHGFARNLPWEVSAQSSTEPEVTLVLKESAETRKIWDQAFELYLTVRLEGDHMLTRLTAKNTGKTPWDFTSALHSYYSVSDISKTTIIGTGLSGKTFVDKTQDPFVSAPLPASEMGITKFLEGVIPDYKGPMALHDKARRVRTTVEHVKGWNDYILWAPVGNDGMGYKSFVCVESGAVSKPVTVAGGAEWVGEMKISSRAG
eukprot:evm.model.NODE_12080_length_44339_cov_18.134035.7